MERRIARSVRSEGAIEEVLLGGISGPDELSQLGRLGAQLILQRAVEDEMAALLGRARYERAPEAAGSPDGHRPSVSSAPSSPRPRPALPATCRRSRSTWPIPSGSASGSARPSCWSCLGRKSRGAPR